MPKILLSAALLVWLALALLAVEAPSQPVKTEPGTGTISGEILFTGKVPPDQKIMTTDGTTIIHNDLVVDAKSKGLRYVAVILEDGKPQPKLTSAKPVEMDQKDMIFIPRVLAVQHGQPVVFTNSDLCNHSVMTATTKKENQLNIFTPANEPYKYTFVPQARPILVGCSLHGWMRAWIYIVEHPWFALTDAKGQFTLHNVPPGSHTLWLHHADTGKQEKRSVEVKAGETVKVKVEWDTAGK